MERYRTPLRDWLLSEPDEVGYRVRLAFLLLHVDGRSPITEIAALTDIPVEDVQAAFLELAALGLVELRGVPAAPSARSSQDEG